MKTKIIVHKEAKLFKIINIIIVSQRAELLK